MLRSHPTMAFFATFLLVVPVSSRAQCAPNDFVDSVIVRLLPMAKAPPDVQLTINSHPRVASPDGKEKGAWRVAAPGGIRPGAFDGSLTHPGLHVISRRAVAFVKRAPYCIAELHFDIARLWQLRVDAQPGKHKIAWRVENDRGEETADTEGTTAFRTPIMTDTLAGVILRVPVAGNTTREIRKPMDEIMKNAREVLRVDGPSHERPGTWGAALARVRGVPLTPEEIILQYIKPSGTR